MVVRGGGARKPLFLWGYKMRSKYLQRHVEYMKQLLTPEGFACYMDKLNNDPAFRRKERKRVTYMIRYRTDQWFWVYERRRYARKYHTDPKERQQNKGRCKKYRANFKARQEKFFEQSRAMGAILDYFREVRRLPVKEQALQCAERIEQCGLDDETATNLRTLAAKWDDLTTAKKRRRAKTVAEVVDILERAYLDSLEPPAD